MKKLLIVIMLFGFLQSYSQSGFRSFLAKWPTGLRKIDSLCIQRGHVWDRRWGGNEYSERRVIDSPNYRVRVKYLHLPFDCDACGKDSTSVVIDTLWKLK